MSRPASRRACRALLGESDDLPYPDDAPQRLVEPFSKLGLVPARVHISSEDGNGEEFSADLRVSGLTQQTAHLVDKALRRIVGVRQVITLAE